MSDTFRSVKVSRFEKAFARAHYLGYVDPNMPREQAKQFREIARMLWDAAGENQDMPTELPKDLAALGGVR